MMPGGRVSVPPFRAARRPRRAPPRSEALAVDLRLPGGDHGRGCGPVVGRREVAHHLGSEFRAAMRTTPGRASRFADRSRRRPVPEDWRLPATQRTLAVRTGAIMNRDPRRASGRLRRRKPADHALPAGRRRSRGGGQPVACSIHRTRIRHLTADLGRSRAERSAGTHHGRDLHRQPSPRAVALDNLQQPLGAAPRSRTRAGTTQPSPSPVPDRRGASCGVPVNCALHRAVWRQPQTCIWTETDPYEYRTTAAIVPCLDAQHHRRRDGCDR